MWIQEPLYLYDTPTQGCLLMSLLHSPTFKLLKPMGGHPTIMATKCNMMSISHFGISNFSVDKRYFFINDLLLVPLATKNFLLVHRFFLDNDVIMEFDAQRVKVHDQSNGELLIEGKEENGLYQLPINIWKRPHVLSCRLGHLHWHCRLGHLHWQELSDLINNNVISSSCCNKLEIYDSCYITKLTHLPHPPSRHFHSSPLSLIHANIWRSSPAILMKGNHYYINFIDSTTHYNWVYPLEKKSDMFDVFLKFQRSA